MPPEPTTVVVVNHNAGALLCESVAAAIDQADRVVVVDNASTDGSIARLEAMFGANPSLLVCLLPKNVGFAAGCNAGMRLAPDGHLVFLNPDSILGPNALERMRVALERDPSVGMVGGLLTNPDGSEQGGGRRAVPTPWRSFVRAFGLSVLSNRWPRLFFDFHLNMQPLPSAPIEVEAISGALMMVKRSAVEDVGGWDEAYFLHCEDLDWCMRFRQKGWHILFVPDAPVVHYLGHSSKERPFFVEWHKHKGMVRFYRKFFSHQYPGALMWLVRLGVWVRFCLVSIKRAVGLGLGWVRGGRG